MFKGTTVIAMNQATMQEAVQEYLQKRVNEDEVRKFTVTEVKADTTDLTFSVKVEEQPKA